MPAMSSYGIDLEYMNNDQPRSKQLSKIDKFGIGTGLIGLVADVVSLTSLFAISSDSKSVPLHIWLLVLLSIVYSITATNFYARQYFHKCALNNSKKFIRKEVKQIEIATLTVTGLVGIPILICYSIFAFIEINRADFLLMFSISGPFIFLDDALRPLFCGIVYGGFFA